MEKPGLEAYSEHIAKAGEAYDSLQKVIASEKKLEANYREALKSRQRAKKPEEVSRLDAQIAWLKEQLQDIAQQKLGLAARVGEHMENHEQGQALLKQAGSEKIH